MFDFSTFGAIFLTCLAAPVDAEFSLGIFTINFRHAFSLGSMPYSGPAMDLAVEQVTSQGVFNVTHTYLSDASALNCDDLTSVTAQLIARYYYMEKRKFNATAAIFPGCSEQTEVINLTREWKILTMIGATGASSTTFRDRRLYPHVISAGPVNPVPYTRLMISMFLSYGWKNVYLAYDSSPKRAFYKELTLGMVRAIRASSINVYLGAVSCSSNETFDEFLQDFRIRSRVLLFNGYPTCTRRLLIAASNKQMTDGDYVYLTAEVQKNTTIYGTLKWQFKDQEDDIARKAFQSLIVLAPIYPHSDFDLAAFSQKLIARSRTDYNFTYPAGEQVNVVARALYECVLMFAQVAREADAENVYNDTASAFDGANLAKRFLDRTFQLPTGPVRIDKSGERSETPAYWFYDPDTMEQKPFISLSQNGSLVAITQPRWPKQWPPPNVPPCGYSGNEGICASQQQQKMITVAVASSAACIVCIIGTAVVFRVLCLRTQIRDDWWKLDNALLAVSTIDDENFQPAKENVVLTAAHYNGGRVHLKQVSVSAAGLKAQERSLNSFLSKLRTLQHSNVNTFSGILQWNAFVWLVDDYCHRKDLLHLYQHGSKLDSLVFRKGLIADFLKGLKFIHESSIKYHGDLQPRRCLIDSRFTLRIAGSGYDRLLRILQPVSGTVLSAHGKTSEWRAPEGRGQNVIGTTRADVYSAGLLLLQLIEDFESKCAALPDVVGATDKDSQLKKKLKSHPSLFPEKVKTLLTSCVVEAPQARPTVSVLFKKYFHLVKPSRTVVSDTLKRMERYSEDLEEMVNARTQELLSERHKCDALLCEMLPRSIVASLRRGNQPPPEFFDGATLSFTDIVGFAEHIATVSPLSVVEFLTKAHGLFDGAILHYDAYKVESIADCYLTVSGLPARNGLRHAEVCCHLAIRFHEVFSSAFGGINVAARSGIHTGPCIAAVVGLKRPRYCLFGDTINTASRMDSSGEGGRIQISDATASHLSSNSGLRCVCRGTIHVKGKGEMKTFWLNFPATDL